MNFVFAFFGQQAEGHRTGNIGTLNSKAAEVNGTKPKSLRTGQETPYKQEKSRARTTSLLGSQSHLTGVFSDDFAAVDFREELCYHSRPKKAKFKRYMERKRKPKKKAMRGGKSGSRRLSGSAGTAPRRRAFSLVFLFVLFVACAWLRRRGAPPQPSTRHSAKDCFRGFEPKAMARSASNVLKIFHI